MKRYAATIDLYIYANSDKEAREKAQKMAELLRKEDDNHASVISVERAEFGEVKFKKN